MKKANSIVVAIVAILLCSGSSCSYYEHASKQGQLNPGANSGVQLKAKNAATVGTFGAKAAPTR